ncbi:MAG TPA: hypothetical protein DCZ94_14125 [Lentisphaeria bacterium]|nr:MAG: hypothetical protein A2X48_10140 [Lentisphaerae bacterium GWF2_49_21]HBC88083.1 hypothetical protein [Lentisphaeria bacterium]
MPCKKTILLVLLFCAFHPCLFCDEAVGPIRQSVNPPLVESKIGYLTALSDLDIEPDSTRIFIAPQTRLPIMQDSGDFYYFLVKIDTSDVCCKIPKYQKYMILMDPSKDKSYMYFRGGIEAEIVPFLISSGEEMPILSSNDNYFFVAVKRRGFSATIKIPRDSKGVSISRESAFAKLSVEQKKKGLEYFNGSWMTPAKAQELRNSQLDKETLRQKRWDALKKQAGSGILILKDGRIIHGTYRGGDKVSIFFESQGDTLQYRIEDVADIDYEKAVSMGNLDSAATLVAQAKGRVDEYPGHARRFLEQAQSFLIKVNPSFTELMGKAMDLGAQVKSMNEGIDSSLKKKNLAIYNYEVFPAAILDYHLKSGHILAGKSWINPEQLCKRCSGGGEISCAKCQAAGKVNKKCPKCDNGRIACHLCEGSGHKVCNICGGLGEFLRTCTRCGGSGVISGYYSYPCGPYLYLSSGAVMVVGTVSPFYYYPNYATRTCPACNGTGRMSTVCSYCGGIGKMVCPKTEKCDLCNGVGFTKVMCPDCEGRGKVTCPDCKGKGFSGAAQKAPGEDEKSPAPSGAAPASGGKSQTMVP